MLICSVSAGEFVSSEQIPAIGYGPQAVFRHTAQYDSNAKQVLIFGGALDSNDYSSDVWSYSTDKNLWTPLFTVTEQISKRQSPASFFDEKLNVMYIFGGQSRVGMLNDLQIFILNSRAWKEVRPDNIPPSPRAFSAYTQHRDDDDILHLYVFGGITNTGFDNELYSYNTDTRQWTWYENQGVKPQKLEAALLCHVNGNLYLFGGHPEFGIQGFNYLYKWDFTQSAWILLITSNEGPISRSYASIAILGDFFYVLYGWNMDDMGPMDDIWKFDTINERWHEVEIDKNVEGYDLVARDSHAYAYYDGMIYMHGGYNVIGLNNSLVRLDMSAAVAKWEIVNYEQVRPSPRIHFSFEIFTTKAYLFGGQVDQDYSDELWQFDLERETWEVIIQQGTRPTPRANHASVTVGNIMFIWGGVSHLNTLNDLLSYNFENQVWSLIIPQSTVIPNPRQGVCMVAKGKNLFIVGGQTENASFKNEVWKFDLGTYEYTLLANSFISGPLPGMNYNCLLRGNKIVVLNGQSYGTTPIQKIYEFDLDTNTWIYVMTAGKTKDQSAIVDLGDKVLVIGGMQWNLWTFHEVVEVDLEAKTDRIIGELPYLMYGHKSVHYRNQIYSFGGGASLGQISTMTHYTNNFVKSTLSGYSCSLGFYQSDENQTGCEICQAGSYSQTFNSTTCELCNKGTQNTYSGSSSPVLCKPCKYGTYNNKKGQRTCNQCELDTICQVGQWQPVPVEEFSMIEYDISDQPDEYTDQAAEAYAIQVGLYVGWSIITVIVMFSLASSHRLKGCLQKVDMHRLHHNYILGEVMVVKLTRFGGIFTVLFLLGIIFLPWIFIVQYMLENILEQKSLVPDFIIADEINDDFDTLATDIEFSLGVLLYGGECVSKNLTCHEDISIKAQNMYGELSKMKCVQVAENCMISFVCQDCLIHQGAKIDLNLQETDSYAAVLILNITSFSSIPDEYSMISNSVAAPKNTVLRGPVPTKFPITFTTSLFKTQEPGGKENTGYHVALVSPPIAGTTTRHDNIYGKFDLKIQIDLLLSEVVLEIQRTEIMSTEILLMSIMSTLVSITGIYELSMKAVERYRARRREWMKQRQQFDKCKTYDIRNIMSQLQTIPHEDKTPVGETEDEEHRRSDEEPIEVTPIDAKPVDTLTNLFGGISSTRQRLLDEDNRQ